MRGVVLLLCAALFGACGTANRAKGGLEPFGPEGASGNDPARRYALVVGVSAFEDERFGDLKFTSADALAVAAALDSFDEVKVLTERDDTTRTSILSALDSLKKRVGANDTLVVYVSTHGTLAHDPGQPAHRVLVATDTRLDLGSKTGIAVRDIVSTLHDSPSSRTALILATCHSGSGKSRIDDDLARALASQKGPAVASLAEVSEASLVLSASAFRETAIENESLGHDVYTYFLLEGLERGDIDNDGAVTASEAHDYARERTYAFTDGRQRPTLVSSVVGRDPIVLSGERKRSANPVLYSYAESAEGLRVSIDGNEKGRLPGGVAVEAGRHRVELRHPDASKPVWSGTVDLAEGERLDVTDLLDRRVRVGLDLGPTLHAPISASVRDRYVPTASGVAGRLSIVNVLFRRSYVEVAADQVYASAETPSDVGALPYDYAATRVQLGFGAHLPLAPRLDFLGGVGGGIFWAERTIDTARYFDEERLQGLSSALFFGAEYMPWAFLSVGARVEGGPRFLRLGGADIRSPLFVGGVLWIGARL